MKERKKGSLVVLIMEQWRPGEAFGERWSLLSMRSAESTSITTTSSLCVHIHGPEYSVVPPSGNYKKWHTHYNTHTVAHTPRIVLGPSLLIDYSLFENYLVSQNAGLTQGIRLGFTLKRSHWGANICYTQWLSGQCSKSKGENPSLTRASSNQPVSASQPEPTPKTASTNQSDSDIKAWNREKVRERAGASDQ